MAFLEMGEVLWDALVFYKNTYVLLVIQPAHKTIYLYSLSLKKKKKNVGRWGGGRGEKEDKRYIFKAALT